MENQQENRSKSELNYSKLLREFIGPFIQAADDLEMIKKKYAFGVHVWNAAAVQKIRPEMLDHARREVVENADSKEEGSALFNELLKIRENDFSDYQRVIMDFDIFEGANGDYQITVATAALKK